MDRNEANFVIDTVHRAMVQDLYLHEWDIIYRVVNTKERHGGEIEMQCEYKRAFIDIYFENIESPMELIETMWHELIHAATSPFVSFAKVAVEAIECETAERIISKVFQDCSERMTKHLELMLKHGIKHDLNKYLDMCRQAADERSHKEQLMESLYQEHMSKITVEDGDKGAPLYMGGGR